MRLIPPWAWSAAALALCPGPGRAMSFDTGGDVRLRWDTTVRASLGLRLDGADAALLADPNADDGDRAFAPGIVSERVDVVSAFDASRGELGLDLSADGWYDPVYLDRTARRTAAAFNPVSVSYDRFPKDVRTLQGGTAELLTAYVHDRVELDGHALTVRVGRQTLLWGESLFSTGNGIAAGQAPVDAIKAAAQPLAEARELFLPVAQMVADLQLRPGADLEAYVQPEWRRDRLPGVSSYFSTTDFLDVGGERLFVGRTALARTRDRTPTGSGQFGVALHLTGGGADLGFYALRFDAKSPQIFAAPPGAYGLVFPRGIELYGVSASGYLGDANIAGEVSWRRRMPLASVLPPVSGAGSRGMGDPYAAGDTLHAQASVVKVVPPGRLWQGAALAAEITCNDRIDITRDPALLAPGLNRFAAGLRAVFTPQYFEVLPHLELTVPVGVGLNFLGNSSVSGGGRAHAGDLDVGVGFTYRTVWQAAIDATHFLGSAVHQTLADRDFVILSVTRTF